MIFVLPERPVDVGAGLAIGAVLRPGPDGLSRSLRSRDDDRERDLTGVDEVPSACFWRPRFFSCPSMPPAVTQGGMFSLFELVKSSGMLAFLTATFRSFRLRLDAPSGVTAGLAVCLWPFSVLLLLSGVVCSGGWELTSPLLTMPEPPYRPDLFFSACLRFWNQTDTALVGCGNAC